MAPSNSIRQMVVNEVSPNLSVIGADLRRGLQRGTNISDEARKLLLRRALAAIAAAETRIAELGERVAQLESLSSTDPLTGLANRRGLMNELTRVLSAARRYGTGGVLIYCDADGFKSINDTYGHATGDAVLCRIAEVLRASVRDIDITARIGGDEFVVVLCQAAWRDGVRRASAIHENLNSARVDIDGQTIPIKASLGVEPFGPHEVAEDLLSRADRAMYAAKRSGAPIAVAAAE